jgi:VWFA-related protein
MNLYLLLGLLSFQNADIQERQRVEFVMLDIVATTKRGEMITDLKKEDFEVLEDKKPMNVTYFEVLDYRDGGITLLDENVVKADGEPPPETPPEKPLQQIIIALDFESVISRDVNKAFKQVESFLNSLDPAFRYDLNLYSLELGSLTKGFTEDVYDALSALDNYRDRIMRDRKRGGSSRARANTNYDPSIPGRGRRNMSNLIDKVNDIKALEEALSDCLQFGTTNGSMGGKCQCIDDTINAFMEEQTFRTERVIGELEILTYKFEKDAKLKTMILISPGFALHNLSSVSQLRHQYKLAAGTCSTRGNPQFGGRMYIEADFKQVIHACIKNRVIFHTFDIFNTNISFRRQFSAEYSRSAGQGITNAYRDYSRQIVSGLRDLAEESGGTFKQVSRLEGTINDTLEQNRFFYVLGYTSPEGKRGDYRTIKVKVKRRGVKLKYRKGYYGR